MAGPEVVHVEVVYCPQDGPCDCTACELGAPATLADALRRSGVLERHGLDAAQVRAGVWGRPCGSESALRDGDRVELYRPLLVTPMQARRLRQQRQAQPLSGSRRR